MQRLCYEFPYKINLQSVNFENVYVNGLRYVLTIGFS